MKLLSNKEAKELYLDGNEIWYCTDDDFEVSDKEDLELHKKYGNRLFLEHEAEFGVAQMTYIGMETQEDDEEDFDKDQTYFSDEEYHYMIHLVFAFQFLQYYDADDWVGMIEAMQDWSVKERVDIFVASNKPIEGYKEITCYSAMMLQGMGVEPIVLSEKTYGVIIYDADPIAIIEAKSTDVLNKLMIQAINEHTGRDCVIIDWETDLRVRFTYLNDDDVVVYDSFTFHVLPKYNSDEN